MKKNLQLLPLHVIATIFTLLFISACSKDKNGKMQTYTIYSPVYKAKSEVLASINGVSTTNIVHAGKLYIKDNFIYLNDVNKGIHIIDNSNPSHPVQVAFLAIPGNLDIAIKGNILYADMYDELLALDIKDKHHSTITNTIKNFFTGRAYLGNFTANIEDKIAVDWNEKD